jgi:ribose 5-phosphate isomerase B
MVALQGVFEMKIAIACDHGAFEFKGKLVSKLEALGHAVVDFGTDSTDSCDYPDHGLPAVQAVVDGDCDRAILSCTNGIGMSMAANKVNGIRAALVYNVRSATMTRQHHDSNCLCLGAKEFSADELLEMVEAWLKTAFEGGRHQRRIDKFPNG